MTRTGSTTWDRTGSLRRSPRLPPDGRTPRPGDPGRGDTRDRSQVRRPSGPVPPVVRRRPRRRRRHRVLLKLVGLSLLLVAAGWALWTGPVLAVATVQVDGVAALPAEEVRKSAGIEAGTPLLRVDVDAVEARVARLPQVAGVEVTRGWPHSVVITVVERVAVAVVGEPGRRSLVDREGVLFDTVTGAAPRGVVPLDVAAPGPGDPATMAALEALVALPGEVRDAIDGVTVTGPEEITLTLRDGTLVSWGGPAESAKKASVLTALLDRVDDGDLEPADTIDLSTPDAVVLR